MALRNWWVEADVDGRRTGAAFGPRGRAGGFRLTVRQRHDGESVRVLTVEGEARADGLLTLRVWDGEGRLLENVATRREPERRGVEVPAGD